MKIIYFILVYCLSINLAYAAPSLKKDSSKLQLIVKKISNLKNNLFFIKHKQHRMQNNLKNIEVKIGMLAKKITYNKTQIIKKHQQLKQIKRQQQKYQYQLAAQKKLLAKQVYASYILGRQPYIKIILNQEDPTKLSRYLYYYAQFNQARLRIIHKIEGLTKNINTNAKNIKAKTCNLQIIQNVYKQHRTAFLQEKNNRQKFLTKTTKELKSKNQQLNKLLCDKKHLSRIIEELHNEYIYGYIPGTSFAQMRSKLHWPINHGKLIQMYGQSLLHGRMHAAGITLRAKTGTKIHAVFPGKVVFADWLHGFGLLAIIQHGKNYMTLYGHNQSLYVKRGDIVKAGQVIATVGNSGGLQASSLYFEIRHNVQPINPLRWLQKA